MLNFGSVCSSDSCISIFLCTGIPAKVPTVYELISNLLIKTCEPTLSNGIKHSVGDIPSVETLPAS